MSYYVADAAGYLADIASIGGWQAFRAWSKTQEPAIRQFVERGMTEQPLALQIALQKAVSTREVQSIVNDLITQCGRAEEILILSDGQSDL